MAMRLLIVSLALWGAYIVGAISPATPSNMPTYRYITEGWPEYMIASIAGSTPHIATIIEEKIVKNGKLDVWSHEMVMELAECVGFGSAGLEAMRAAVGLDGKLLSTLCEACGEQLAAVGISSPQDVRLWGEIFAAIKDIYALDNLASTGGAEDLDLIVIIHNNQAVFHAFLIALHLSPHMALAMVHFYNEIELALIYLFAIPPVHGQGQGKVQECPTQNGKEQCAHASTPKKGPSLDDIMYGSDEAKNKGLLNKGLPSFIAFLLMPGLLACTYALAFLDTNPYLVVFLVLTYGISDFYFWLELLLFVSGRKRDACLSFCLRALSAVVYAGAYLDAINHHLPEIAAALDVALRSSNGAFSASFAFTELYVHHVQMLSTVLLCLTLGVTALNNVRRLHFMRSQEWRLLWEHFFYSKRVVVHAKREAVRKALRGLVAEDLFSPTDWTALYARDATKLGRGAFGECFAGTVHARASATSLESLGQCGRKGTLGDIGSWVAIKIFKPKPRAEDVERAYSLFLRIMDPSQSTTTAGAVCEDFLNIYKTQERKEVEEARAEVRALRCVAAAYDSSPNLLKLCSAHKTPQEVVVVTQQIVPNPQGLWNQPLSVRLSAVQVSAIYFICNQSTRRLV